MKELKKVAERLIKKRDKVHNKLMKLAEKIEAIQQMTFWRLSSRQIQNLH